MLVKSANIRCLLLWYAQYAPKTTKQWQIQVTLTFNTSLKMLFCHFRHFHCSNFKMTFDKNYFKKSYHFLHPSKFLLCCKILISRNRWQVNDYRKYPLNNSQNLHTQNCLLSICGLQIHEIFNFWICVSKICANCCIKITSHS